MKPEREAAALMMQNMGWTAERKKHGATPVWKFSRPDTGGLWDAITIRQDQLSFGAVAKYAMDYGDAPALVAEITDAKDRWLERRFLGILAAMRKAQ